MTARWIKLALLLFIPVAHGWLNYSSTGEATLTHYTMDLNFIASCGCTAGSTHYPTAAMSETAYGSTDSYGPGCGRCFNFTLQNTYTPDPPFLDFPPTSIVVKVTDHCPLGGDWCNATDTSPNKGGRYINFDLVYPSKAIPNNFFPSNESLYGYTDFGVWNVTYSAVSCDEWAGGKNQGALGSVPSLESGGCCPADPFTNTSSVCPSFSEDPSIAPPNTASSHADRVDLGDTRVWLALLLVATMCSVV